MIKEEIIGITGERGGKANSVYKLETALAWIRCMQKGSSPIDKLREEGKEQIILYGITELGEFLVEEARKKKFKILAITDRAVQSGGYEYQGITMLKRGDIGRYQDEVIVVTSMTFWKEIRDELYAEGCRHVIPLRDLL